MDNQPNQGQQHNQNNSQNQNFKPGVGTKLKSFLIQSKRVWHILRKPTNEEFKSIAKISALGIGALGLLGFIIGDIMMMIR